VPDALDFRPVEIEFAIFITNRVKLTTLDHPQHCAAAAVKRIGRFLNCEAGGVGRFGISWPEPAIEQIREPVFQDGSFLADFGKGQFGAKLNRFFINYNLAKYHLLRTHIHPWPNTLRKA
jgi:hypothetical protein